MRAWAMGRGRGLERGLPGRRVAVVCFVVGIRLHCYYSVQYDCAALALDDGRFETGAGKGGCRDAFYPGDSGQPGRVRTADRSAGRARLGCKHGLLCRRQRATACHRCWPHGDMDCLLFVIPIALLQASGMQQGPKLFQQPHFYQKLEFPPVDSSTKAMRVARTEKRDLGCLFSHGDAVKMKCVNIRRLQKPASPEQQSEACRPNLAETGS